jgi:hypothetical protein
VEEVVQNFGLNWSGRGSHFVDFKAPSTNQPPSFPLLHIIFHNLGSHSLLAFCFLSLPDEKFLSTSVTLYSAVGAFPNLPTQKSNVPELNTIRR